jgi:hypothetical protein
VVALDTKPLASSDIEVADACLRGLTAFSCRLRNEPLLCSSFNEVVEEATVEFAVERPLLLEAVPARLLVPALVTEPSPPPFFLICTFK